MQHGWRQVRHNTKLLFLVVILFVFPVLFVVVLERFYAVATANIQTAELARTATLHESVAILLSLTTDTELKSSLTVLQAANTDVTTLRVYTGAPDDSFTLVAASAADVQSTSTTPGSMLQLARVAPQETFTVPLTRNGDRIEQSVRYQEINGVAYYIFSEHSRAQVDAVLMKRKQDAYILLSLIFIFLISLAYWFNRQTDWEKRYTTLHNTLQQRDLFSNMIAHEFRAPLTAIKGYASFLQDSDVLPSEERRYADTIRESAERLVLLVNDFLEVARIQSGKMNIEPSVIDVRTTIATVIDSMTKEANSKDLTLAYTPANTPQQLYIDQNRLIQVLTNIISNSIKYTKTGQVAVSCEEDRSGVVIRVKDTGMGITAEDQQKLFTPFARVGGVEHTTITGTGLGMWITKQMIELLHGSITVESIQGVGTHVVLRFTRTDPDT